MAIGIVGESGLVMNAVAPNSPIEMAKAKAAPTRMERQTSRRSIVHQAIPGLAPSVAAASRR